MTGVLASLLLAALAQTSLYVDEDGRVHRLTDAGAGEMAYFELRAAGDAALGAGQPERAIELYRQGLDALGDGDPALRAEAGLRIGDVYVSNLGYREHIAVMEAFADSLPPGEARHGPHPAPPGLPTPRLDRDAVATGIEWYGHVAAEAAEAVPLAAGEARFKLAKAHDTLRDRETARRGYLEVRRLARAHADREAPEREAARWRKLADDSLRELVRLRDPDATLALAGADGADADPELMAALREKAARDAEADARRAALAGLLSGEGAPDADGQTHAGPPSDAGAPRIAGAVPPVPAPNRPPAPTRGWIPLSLAALFGAGGLAYFLLRGRP